MRSYFLKGQIIRQKKEINHLTEIIKTQKAIRFEVENQINKILQNLTNENINLNCQELLKNYSNKIKEVENEANFLFSKKMQNSFINNESNDDDFNLIELIESLFNIFQKINKLANILLDVEKNKTEIEEINIELIEDLKFNINTLIYFSIGKVIDWKKPSNESSDSFIINPEKNLRNQNIFHNISEKIDSFLDFKIKINENSSEIEKINQNLFKKFINNSPIYFPLLEKTIENLKNNKNPIVKNLVDLKKYIYLDFFFNEKQIGILKYLYLTSKKQYFHLFEITKKTITQISTLFNHNIFIAISDIFNVYEKERNNDNFLIILANVLELYIGKIFKNSNRINDVLKSFLEEKIFNFELLEEKIVQDISEFSDKINIKN